MKRCSDLEWKLVFLQLVQVLRNVLEECFKGEVKDNFVYSGGLEAYSNKVPILSRCHMKDSKGCNASITGLRYSPSFSLQFHIQVSSF